MHRVAMISVHACPLARLGSKETGGMNVYVRELSTELARAGLAVDVYTRRTDPDEQREVEMAPGVRLVRVAAGQAGPMDKYAVFDHLPEFIAGLEAYRRERGLAYDLVHSHYWLSAWAGERLAGRWQVPHVTMFHTLGAVKNLYGAPGNERHLRIRVEREAIAAVNRVIAASEDERTHLISLYAAVPERIAIIPCGVNTRLFRRLDREQARAALGLNGGWVALFVGRMDPLKGLDVLLHAAALLAAAAPSLQIVVVGGDAVPESEETRVRELARSLGLGGKVRFDGAVPQTALPLYYNAADVCVVPSYYESFGLVAVEALACGTPVVASRVGGLTNVVKHRENGLLVAERSPAAFAAALAELQGDEGLRAGLAARARSSVRHLVWEAIAQRVSDLYHSLWAEASVAAPKPCAAPAGCGGHS